MNLKMSLNAVFTQGTFQGMTLKEAIDKDVTSVDNMKQAGFIIIDREALVYLINARTVKINRRFNLEVINND